MIDRTDVLLLLTDLLSKGANVSREIQTLYNYPTVRVETLKKINSLRPLDLLTFYEKIRDSYNKKHSKLYINIMKSDENLLESPDTVLTTLTALQNLIFQFKCDDKIMFLKHARAEEITKVIKIYLDSYSLKPAIKLLKLIKADIKVLEML